MRPCQVPLDFMNGGFGHLKGYTLIKSPSLREGLDTGPPQYSHRVAGCLLVYCSSVTFTVPKGLLRLINVHTLAEHNRTCCVDFISFPHEAQIGTVASAIQHKHFQSDNSEKQTHIQELRGIIQYN